MPFGLGFFATAGAGAAGSFDLLETQVLGTAVASVTFSSLSTYSNYQHLQIRYVARSSQANEYAGISMTFNSDTASNYSWHGLKGDGGSVSSSGVANSSAVETYQWEMPGASNAANIFGAGVYDILDLFETTKNKTVRWFGGRGAVNTADKQIVLGSGAWRNTTAISSIRLATSATFVVGSRFSLYGIKAA